MPRKKSKKKNPREMISFGDGEKLSRKKLEQMNPEGLKQHDAVSRAAELQRQMVAAIQEYRSAVVEIFGTMFDEQEEKTAFSHTCHTFDRQTRARFRMKEQVGLNAGVGKAMTLISEWLDVHVDGDGDLIRIVSEVFQGQKMSVVSAVKFTRIPVKDEKLKAAQQIIRESIEVHDTGLSIEVKEKQEDGTWAKVA